MSGVHSDFNHDISIPVHIRTGTSTRRPENPPEQHRWINSSEPISVNMDIEIIPYISRRGTTIGRGVALFRLLSLLQSHDSDPNEGGLVRDDSIVLDIENRQCSSSEVGQVCNICQENFERNDALTTLDNCSHTFHHHCIEEWGFHKQECPLCREPIPVLEE